jgi:hypothetical protein
MAINYQVAAKSLIKKADALSDKLVKATNSLVSKTKALKEKVAAENKALAKTQLTLNKLEKQAVNKIDFLVLSFLQNK